MGYTRAIHYAASIALVCAGEVVAQAPQTFATGNGVLAICGSGEPSETIRCYAFIEGLAQGMAVMAARDKSRKPFCLPPGSTYGQYNDVIVKGLQDRPATRHFNGTLLVTAFLHQAFPCPENK